MTDIQHPSNFIASELAGRLRNLAPEAEKKGALHEQQLEIIYNQNWFNLFVPEKYNGLALSLIEGLQIEEALAYTDGSIGWTTTLCSGANLFVGYLHSETADLFFANKNVCFAGSGQATGTAKIIGDEYEITGYWKYATGAPHATGFTCNCVIEKDGTTLLNQDGSPLTQSFLFLREEVTIHKNWHCMGMIATAGHSFEVNNVRVSANRTFKIDSAHAVLSSPIYQYPFLQFAEATLGVNYCGMALRFLDLCKTILPSKVIGKNYTPARKNLILDDLQTAEVKLRATRAEFYKAVEDSWNAHITNTNTSQELLSKVSTACYTLAATAKETVNKLFPYCGIAAADPDTEMNRLWRDLHTAGQHTLLLFK